MSASTEIIAVDPTKIGSFSDTIENSEQAKDWRLRAADTADYKRLERAAELLRTSTIPVAFPTETVYGLGADATRSEAVKGIYKAKQRPSDNPLIVHFATLIQLKSYLKTDIPSIYHELIKRFWPGPLTILLQLPEPSPFAPEVSAGLSTFGARIPRNAIALGLIQTADRPIAAPSANASTKPSPTAAEHVYDDLAGRIEMIVDGGPCSVGVESTVVDGLSDPPAILRPGAISLEQLRRFGGWEKCVVGYKDKSEGEKEDQSQGKSPRAPGMKYRHYSPKAKVLLYERGAQVPSLDGHPSVGIVRTATWPEACGVKLTSRFVDGARRNGHDDPTPMVTNGGAETVNVFQTIIAQPPPKPKQIFVQSGSENERIELWEVDLGADLDTIARGLFSALRELDRKGVGTIFVEGIDDTQGELAAAIMNRLRKASSVIVSP